MKEQEKIEILEKIDLYIKGKLSQEEIDNLWKTFLQHPEMYDWFETELHLKSLIRKGKRPDFGSETKKEATIASINGYQKWLFAAAAAVIIAIGLQFFAMQPPEPVSAFAVVQIDETNLIGADILRSGDETTEEIDVLINRALAMAYEAETESAIMEFEEILDQLSDDVQRARIQMNIGILQYNLGQFKLARDSFQEITEVEELTKYQEEQAYWFLGNVYLNLNQPIEAREAVFHAYNLDGRFQPAAMALLEKLDERIGNVPTEKPARLGD